MRFGAWLRYFRYLPIRKVIGRLWFEVKSRTLPLGARRARVARNDSGYDWASLVRFSEAYLPLGARFTHAQLMYEGVFDSKGIRHDFGSPDRVVWGNPFEDSKFEHWEHDLSFFSFLLPLAEEDPARCVSLAAILCRRIEQTTSLRWGKRPAFVNSPIALSLRIMALSAVLGQDSVIGGANSGDRRVIERHLERSSALLRWTLERHLGYNHLVFGMSALAVMGAIGAGQSDHIDMMAAELERCLLPDGFWAERSPTYHIHMLFLAQAVSLLPGASEDSLASIDRSVRRMTKALGIVVHPDGEIAIFNDAAIDDAVPPRVVGWLPPTAEVGVAVGESAGFARLWANDVAVIMDAGPMGPDEVIGHGHADFLSFEASFAGHRLIVDPGVASISGGPLREWTRSAKSHNGPTFDGVEPAEFFGTWRVGRRGRAWLFRAGESIGHSTPGVKGVCDGYVGRGLITRTMTVGSGRLEWTDEARAQPEDRVTSMYLIPSEWTVEESNGVIKIASPTPGIPYLYWTFAGARLQDISSSRVHLKGPMIAATATAVVFEHVAESATFTIVLDRGSGLARPVGDSV